LARGNDTPTDRSTVSNKYTGASGDTAVAMSVSFADSGQALGNERSKSVSLGDLDGDGDLDALVGNEEEVEVWLNDGQGIFTESGQELDIPSGWSISLDLGDLDGDNDLDAFVVVFEGTSRVLLNDGGIQGGVSWDKIRLVFIAHPRLGATRSLPPFTSRGSRTDQCSKAIPASPKTKASTKSGRYPSASASQPPIIGVTAAATPVTVLLKPI
jgi:hypothetical protein